MKGGQTPIHILRFSPADYLGDLAVKLALARQDYRALVFYDRFIFVSHQSGGDLPSEPQLLAVSLAMRVSLVRKAMAYWIDQGKLVLDGDVIYNPRIRREVAKELAIREVQSHKGREGAGRRWSGSTNGSTDGSTHRTPDSPPSPTPAPTPAPIERVATQPGATPPAPPLRLTPPPTGNGKVTAAKETWLTPYGDAWRDRWGPESEPPWGEMAKELSAAEKTLGGDRMEGVARWRRFLASADRSEWARPGRFRQGLGQWAEAPQLASAQGFGTTRRMTAAEVTTQTVREIAAREMAKKGGGT